MKVEITQFNYGRPVGIETVMTALATVDDIEYGMRWVVAPDGTLDYAALTEPNSACLARFDTHTSSAPPSGEHAAIMVAIWDKAAKSANTSYLGSKKVPYWYEFIKAPFTFIDLASALRALRQLQYR